MNAWLHSIVKLRNRNCDLNQRPEGEGGMKTIPFKPRAPETRTDVNVISWPMRRLTIDVPIDLHIRLKTGCAMRGEKIADVVRVLIEREFAPRP
jgi:hypothetical protein